MKSIDQQIEDVKAEKKQLLVQVAKNGNRAYLLTKELKRLEALKETE